MKLWRLLLIWLGLLIMISPPAFAYQDDLLIDPNIPLNQPNINDIQLESWASKAATLPYNFTFENYKDNLNEASHYFTKTGWQAFDKMLWSSDNLQNLEKNEMSVVAAINGKPHIAARGLADNHYAWKISIPMRITVKGHTSVHSKAVTAILKVTRVPATVSPQGIAIEKYSIMIRSVS